MKKTIYIGRNSYTEAEYDKLTKKQAKKGTGQPKDDKGEKQPPKK